MSGPHPSRRAGPSRRAAAASAGTPRPMIAGRYADVAAVAASDQAVVAYAEGAAYDSVALGAGALPIERNSVLLVPALLSASECAALVADVERHRERREADPEAADAAGNWRETVATGGGFQRYRIPLLSEQTNALFEELLRERLLPFLLREFPDLERYMWARSDGICAGKRPPSPPPERPAAAPLASLPFQFSPQEPAINRYAEGGLFPQHTDQQALTLNVLLSDNGTFDGGGTAFWREDAAEAAAPVETRAAAELPAKQARTSPATAAAGAPLDCAAPAYPVPLRNSAADADADAALRPPTLTVQPRAGVGVVFNGTVQHAGNAVTKGVRHVLVASFSIANAEYVGLSAKRSRRLWISNGS